MKRSKMIQLMHDTLYKNYGHTDLDLSIPEVEALLTVMENKGMLPPEIEIECYPYGIKSGIFIDYRNDWEPEDEKN